LTGWGISEQLSVGSYQLGGGKDLLTGRTGLFMMWVGYGFLVGWIAGRDKEKYF